MKNFLKFIKNCIIYVFRFISYPFRKKNKNVDVPNVTSYDTLSNETPRNDNSIVNHDLLLNGSEYRPHINPLNLELNKELSKDL